MPVEHIWTIEDLTAPETTIESGPEAEVSIEPELPTSFTFSSNELDAEFECSLDAGATWSQCASPPENTYEPGSLEAGEQTLLVRAVDPSLNADPTPASYTWTVVGPPITSIISGAPAAETEETSATIAFSADQSPVTYVCTIDGAQVVADCTSPRVFTDLALGDHSLEIEATNRFGLIEEQPVLIEWTVVEPADTINPDTTITTPPPAVAPSTSASIAFVGSDNVTLAGDMSFECSLDGAAFAGCSSPEELTGLAETEHTFAVRAIDAAGNVDETPASVTWTIDVPPEANTLVGTNVEVAVDLPAGQAP